MTTCIGRMGGRAGDWRAELEFDGHARPMAQVLERSSTGVMIEVCAAPLGMIVPESEYHSPQLDPACEINQRLMKIVFAPEAWRVLQVIREELESRAPLEDRGQIRPDTNEIRDAELLREVCGVLECLEVPTE